MNTFSVTVRRSAPGRWGEQPTTTTHQVQGCIRWPRGSGEERLRSDVVTTGWMLSAPVDADIRPTDQVQLPGDPTWWDVEGDPQPYQSPFTEHAFGTPIALTRTTG